MFGLFVHRQSGFDGIVTQLRIEIFLDFNSNVVYETRQIVFRGIDRLGEQADVVYRFVTDDPVSEFAARAVCAADRFDHAAEMVDYLAANEGNYSKETVLQLARRFGIDLRQFEHALYSLETTERLAEDRQVAEKSGLAMAPGVTINGVPYNGAWDEEAFFEALRGRDGRRVEYMVEGFLRWGASAAFSLLLATAAALVFVNSGGAHAYEKLREATLGLTVESVDFLLTTEAWISDGLMSLFFLLIGIEIKREVLFGELSDFKRAAMPVIGALGGMVVPAALYLLVNWGTPTASGWGVPMATDIAFTLGLLALLGRRVPLSLKVFVSALAVADDLGAIIVIAVFYGHGFEASAFGLALIVTALLMALNRTRVYAVSVYLVLGILLWYFLHNAGIHATLAGVITAIMIPSRPSGNLIGVAEQARLIFAREISSARQNMNHDGIRPQALHSLQSSIDRLREPGYHLERALERWVNFLILPLFAFFSTGILLGGTLNLATHASVGIVVGLCIGKPLGIVGACWIATRLNLAEFSSDISWRHLIGVGALAGVGFTMSIVVATAAFADDTLVSAKLSVLLASIVSAVVGILALAWPDRASRARP
ncbi:MAG: Na+/H+ antiporter NhaA [Cyanobacteria bacterium J06555_12]